MYVFWKKLIHKVLITKVFLEVQNIKMLQILFIIHFSNWLFIFVILDIK